MIERMFIYLDFWLNEYRLFKFGKVMVYIGIWDLKCEKVYINIYIYLMDWNVNCEFGWI